MPGEVKRISNFLIQQPASDWFAMLDKTILGGG
jgi:hypothetical protein